MNRKFQQSLSLQKKLEILNDIDSKKLKQIEIANKYSIAKSTVSMILKNREKIEAACVLKKFDPNRKRMRRASNDDLEVALIRWMNKAREQNMPITGPILQEKARFFADALGATHFLGSSGWLQRFKDRHGRKFGTNFSKKICGEEPAINGDMLENFINLKLQTILSKYVEADIFNVTITSLLWKVLPSQTLIIKGTICCCGKCSKERLTLLIACNIAGTEKLPLLVIGNAEKPHCFSGVKTLPVTYGSSKQALITVELFRKWVEQLDRKFEREGRNICLILDNCDFHSAISGLKAIQIEFLPSSTTTKLQPCNQGIIKCIKAYYRREILCQAIFCFNQGMSFSINLLDALNILRAAWKEVSPHTIQNCFKKAGFFSKETLLNPGIEEGITFDSSEAKACGVLPEDVTFEEYVSMDDEVMISAAVTDDEIISDINCNKNTTSIDNLHHSSETPEDDDDDDDDASDFYNVTTTEAFYALKTIRQFVMQAENSNELLDAVDKLDDMWKQAVVDKNKK